MRNSWAPGSQSQACFDLVFLQCGAEYSKEKSIGFELRTGFRPQLYHLLVLWPSSSYSVSVSVSFFIYKTEMIMRPAGWTDGGAGLQRRPSQSGLTAGHSGWTLLPQRQSSLVRNPRRVFLSSSISCSAQARGGAQQIARDDFR